MNTTRNIKRRKTKAQHQRQMKKYWKRGMIFLAVLLVAMIGIRVLKPEWLGRGYIEFQSDEIDASKPDIDVELLTVNPYSRPGAETNRITGIVVHYTANPGSTAMENRDYFEGLKDSHETQASSNFIVGLDGEVVQCVPTWEVAYASNSRNIDTVSIECCHPDETGEFTQATYDSLVKLTACLCDQMDLTSADVIRHYDVNEKECPKYFVDHEDAWQQFREDVDQAIADKSWEDAL